MLRGPVRIDKRLLTLAALAAASLLSTPQSARAALQLALQEDGGPGFTIVAGDATSASDFTSFSYTTPTGSPFGDFKITIFGGSSNNGSALSDLMSSTTSIENLSGATHTLHLWVTQTNYDLPAGTPLTVEAGLGGSVGPGTVGLKGIFDAYAYDQIGGLNDPLAPFNTTGTHATADATQTGSTFDTGSRTGSLNRTLTYFALTSVANITLSGHGKVNFSSHINVTPAPEPATMTMVLIALPFVGFMAHRSRRRRATA